MEGLCTLPVTPKGIKRLRRRDELTEGLTREECNNKKWTNYSWKCDYMGGESFVPPKRTGLNCNTAARDRRCCRFDVWLRGFRGQVTAVQVLGKPTFSVSVTLHLLGHSVNTSGWVRVAVCKMSLCVKLFFLELRGKLASPNIYPEEPTLLW